MVHRDSIPDERLEPRTVAHAHHLEHLGVRCTARRDLDGTGLSLRVQHHRPPEFVGHDAKLLRAGLAETNDEQSVFLLPRRDDSERSADPHFVLVIHRRKERERASPDKWRHEVVVVEDADGRHASGASHTERCDGRRTRLELETPTIIEGHVHSRESCAATPYLNFANVAIKTIPSAHYSEDVIRRYTPQIDDSLHLLIRALPQ